MDKPLFDLEERIRNFLVRLDQEHKLSGEVARQLTGEASLKWQRRPLRVREEAAVSDLEVRRHMRGLRA
jgi:hypothetical protein